VTAERVALVSAKYGAASIRPKVSLRDQRVGDAAQAERINQATKRDKSCRRQPGCTHAMFTSEQLITLLGLEPHPEGVLQGDVQIR